MAVSCRSLTFGSRSDEYSFRAHLALFSNCRYLITIAKIAK